MKYLCKTGCEWRAFKATAGQLLTAADLVSDGQPLPTEVVGTLVRIGCLEPVTE